MKTMQVMRFNDSTDAPALIPGVAPIPQPGPGQLLIRIHAAGVTPTELLWHPTTHSLDGGIRRGAIPGHEFSGVIAAVGPQVDPSQIGKEVFGMNDWFADGATAEYCLAAPAAVAAKPARLSHAEAASVPIGALTAWQGLVERLKLQPGERILVHGGAGAVGIFVVQFARRIGAQVIATASPQNIHFLKELGADKLIDYQAERFEEYAGKVDAVFDAVGGETLRRSWAVLAPSGRLVTVAADSEGMQDERTKNSFFIITPNGGQLGRVAGLLDTGELRCFVGAVVPLADASDAYLSKGVKNGHHGKVVLLA